MKIDKIWSRLSNVSWLVNNCRETALRKFICSNMLKLRRKVRGGGVLVTDVETVYRSILADAGRAPEKTVEDYIHELLQWNDLRDHWERKAKEISYTKYTDWDHRIRYSYGVIAIYYGLARELKPKVIVETGTASGGMTVFLLAAVKRNGVGRVISIDIPPRVGELTMDQTIDPKDIGYWIPELLREAWEYRLGDAKVLLPRVLIEEDVEMFVHDSLHTRTHMAFEYAVARALMPHGSLIATDDILWNNAFDSFLATHLLTGYAPITNPNSGIVVNLFDDYERSIGTGIVEVGSGA